MNYSLAFGQQSEDNKIDFTQFFNRTRTIEDVRGLFDNALPYPTNQDLFFGKIWFCHAYVLTNSGLYDNEGSETFLFSNEVGFIENNIPGDGESGSQIFLRTESELVGIVDLMRSGATHPQFLYVRKTKNGDLISELSTSNKKESTDGIIMVRRYLMNIFFKLREKNINPNNLTDEAYGLLKPLYYPSIAVEGRLSPGYLFCPKEDLKDASKD